MPPRCARVAPLLTLAAALACGGAGDSAARSSAAVDDRREVVAHAIRDAQLVTPPHDEQGYLAPSAPAALAWRVALARGAEVSVEFQLLGDASARVYIEAFARGAAGDTAVVRVAAADSGSRRLAYTADRDGDVTVVAQPEPGHGGRFVAYVRVRPAT